MPITFRDISIAYDGETIECVDVNGNSTEPFIMDGSVYIPVRVAVNILGLEVDWDEGSNTVNLYGTVTNVDDQSAYAIVQKAQNYAASLAIPDWAMELIQSALDDTDNHVVDNITDGTRLAQLAPRYEAAIMALRAREMAISSLSNEEAYAIVQKAQAYAESLEIPEWASELVNEAIDDTNNSVVDNITDGTRLAQLSPRYEAAIMALRARAQAYEGLTDEECYNIVQRAANYTPTP